MEYLEAVLTRQKFRWGLLGLFAVYLSGWIAPLFENDSAQFAVMSMRMVQEGDFLNLFKGTEPYLDKPHLHYWISALSMKVFGIHDWAYRLTALLAAALTAFSLFGLGKTLYDSSAGRLSAWIFLSSQTIVLSYTDLRTDAWLTAFTALSIWQWALYNRYRETSNLLLCALGAGLAFSTKGHIALVAIGSAVFADLLYTRNWKNVLDARLGLAVLVFALTISPVLYAYYQQFDLHPELVIRGRDQRSGLWFILWEQSFERLSGEGIGKNSPDYFFFFHTFLWVTLPWTPYALWSLFGRARTFLSNRFRRRRGLEFLTLGSFLLVFPLMSAAQFKLPHYLNVLIPVTAVLTAAFLSRPGIYRNPVLRSWFVNLAKGVFGLSLLVAWILCTWVFPLRGWPGYLLLVLGTCLGLLIAFRRQPDHQRLFILGLYTSLLINFVLNAHFYPRLLNYQGGSSMAEYVRQEGIPANRIYKVSDRYTWAMDFYLKSPVKQVDEGGIAELDRGSYLYLDEREWSRLSGRPEWEFVHRVDHFRITRLSLPFLNPARRASVLESRYLLLKR